MLLLLTVAFNLGAQERHSPFGLWKSVDDKTGKPKSIVYLYRYNDKMYGRVLAIIAKNDEDTIDHPVRRVAGKVDNPFIAGLDVIADMEKVGNKGKWGRGTVLEPEKGSAFRCEIWMKEGELHVRGYWGPFHRTQVWLPATEDDFLYPIKEIPKNPIPVSKNF